MSDTHREDRSGYSRRHFMRTLTAGVVLAAAPTLIRTARAQSGNPQPVEFKSQGLRCRGLKYLPADLKAGEKRPCIVLAHGFSAVKEMYFTDYAEAFSKAGFVIAAAAGGAATTVPTQTAGTASGNFVLRAVKTNTTTAACEAAIAGATTVDWAYECNDPAACSGSNLMRVNGGTATTVQRNNNGSVSSYISVPTTFDASGNASFSFIFDDVGETHVVELENAVLHHRQAESVANADATVHLTRALLVRLGIGEAGVKDLVMSDDLKVEGSRLKLLSFLSLLDKPDTRFPIVTP